MLNQRVERHGKQPHRKNPSQRPRMHARERVVSANSAEARKIEQRTKHRHTHGAERNQSVLDFSAGKIAGRDAADPDSDSNGRLQDS